MRLQRGLSMVMVVILLGALLSLAIPFALSMRLQDKSSKIQDSDLRSRFAAEAGMRLAMSELMATHGHYERQTALAAGDLDSLGEDVDGLDEVVLNLPLSLSGVQNWSTTTSTGSLTSVRMSDEQGKLDLNTGAPGAIGNLIGATVLRAAADERSSFLVVENPALFPSDGKPETIDGILLIGPHTGVPDTDATPVPRDQRTTVVEVLLYRHINPENGRIEGLVRFPGPTDALIHRSDSIVRDARFLKIAAHPFLAQPGQFQPFESVAALRQVADWSFVRLLRYLPGFSGELFTAGTLRRAGIAEDVISELELDRDHGFQRGETIDLDGAQRQRMRDFLAAFLEVRRAGAVGVEGFSAGELGRLMPYLTVHARAEAVWSDPQRVPHSIRFNAKQVTTSLELNSAGDFAWPCIVRVGPLGGPYEYARSWPSANGIVCWPPLRREHNHGEAYVSARPMPALNVNTAELPVLAACLTMPNRPPAEAAERAQAIAQARPLSRYGELYDMTNPRSSQAMLMIAERQRLGFESHNVFSIEAENQESGASRNLLGEFKFRSVVALGPSEESVISIDSQDDFLASLHSRGVPDAERWRRTEGNVPRTGRQSHLVRTSPDLEFSGPWAQGDPSHRPDRGDLRIQHLVENPAGSLYLESYHSEPDGGRIGNRRLGLDASHLPTAELRSPEGDLLETAAPAPFQWSAWVLFDGLNSAKVIEIAADDSDQNRIRLSYDPGRELLQLEVYDGCLDGGSPRAMALRGTDRLREKNWYHVFVQVFGTRVGEQVLMLDGKVLAENPYRTHLTADIDHEALTLSVEDASNLFIPGENRGPILVGNEIMEVSQTSRTQLRVLNRMPNPLYDPNNPATANLPPIIRQPTRNSMPTPHTAGAVVQPFGYTAALTDRLFVGEATLTQDRPEVMPWTLLARSESTHIPTVDSLGTSLPVAPELGTTGFPDQGFLSIVSDSGQAEIVYYAGRGPSAFTGVVRGLFPQFAHRAASHRAYQAVVLVSFETSPTADYLDTDGTRFPWVQFNSPGGYEWIHYLKGEPQGYPEHLLLPGFDGHLTPPNDLYRTLARYWNRQIPWPANPQEILVNGEPLITYVRRIQPTTEISCRGRHDKGTSPRAWTAGTPIIPVVSTNSWRIDSNDRVTVTDQSRLDPDREEHRIRHNAFPNTLEDVVGAGAVYLFALDDFVQRPYERSDAARLLMWPTGDMGDRAYTQARLSTGSGRIDEVKTAALRVQGSQRTPGEGPWPQVSNPNVTISCGPIAATLNLAGSTLSSTGAVGNMLYLVDEEAVTMADPSQRLADGAGVAQSGTSESTEAFVRGLLESAPARHSVETPWTSLPFPGCALVATAELDDETWAAGISGSRGRDGYWAIDRGNGAGFSTVYAYERTQGAEIRRPLDDRGEPAFRGAFGSRSQEPKRGDILIEIPARFHDRHRAQTAHSSGVYYQISIPLHGARVTRISWDEQREDPLSGADIQILARLDGRPHWDAPTSRQPRDPTQEIYLFNDPGAENRIDQRAQNLELRVYFPFGDDAFVNDRWKTSPVLQNLRIHVEAPSQILWREEVSGWR